MKDKILVVGSSNVDLIMKMDRLPAVGETITDADFIQTFGGKGANQAVGAAKSGGKVTFINCVGDDAYVPLMLANFEAVGIDTQYIFKDQNISSGHALVMIGDEGNNYLSVAPGSNYNLTPERIDEVSHLFEEAAMVLLQCEIPENTIQHVIDLCAAKHIKIMWNFAPARKFDLKYLSKTDIIIANETEAEFLSGIKITDKESAHKAANVCLEKGVKQVVITLGKGGSLAVSSEGSHFAPIYIVEAVDTTAAGGVYCGSLATALVENKSMSEAMNFASAASALCVTKLGAQPSAPTREEIDSLLACNV